MPATRQIIETRDLNIPPFEFNTTGVWVDSTTRAGGRAGGRCVMAPTLTQSVVCGRRRTVPVWVYGYFAAPVRGHFSSARGGS